MTERILITGTAGFIGYHVAKILLDQGKVVCGIDSITDYYDVNLKKARHKLLSKFKGFSYFKISLEETRKFHEAVELFSPDIIIHLAAQAGVRYSLDNPKAYLDSNVFGTFNVLEVARSQRVRHLLIASTSSVYGSNTEVPFDENQHTDTPLTFYAATKKANEVMAHSYAHLWRIPITMLRFFTVYGPWGRPDMALFKFTKGILEDSTIDLYNNGEMWRDFTFVEDVAWAVSLLKDVVPQISTEDRKIYPADSLSEVAPFRVVNIGNSKKVQLMDFVSAIEQNLGKKAICNFMEIQKGDVPMTWANVGLLKSLTGYEPNTDVEKGVGKFLHWYRKYFNM